MREAAAVSPTTGFRVLIPYDGSGTARHAVEFLPQLPVNHVTLIHVVPSSYRIVPPLTDGEKEAWIAEVAPDMQEIANTLNAQGTPASIEIRSGEAATEIIDAARSHDLIVMTTAGKGATARLIFGNVADRVSRGAETPTLLLRGTLVSDGVQDVHRIVVPLDGSDLSSSALPLAVTLAQDMGAPMLLVRVTDYDTVLQTARQMRREGQVDPAGDEDLYDLALRQATLEAEDYLKAQVKILEEQGIQVEMTCPRGAPVHTLLDMLDGDDLVVMTSHGQSGYRRWLLGSVAEKLVREAKAPVMLVPTRNA